MTLDNTGLSIDTTVTIFDRLTSRLASKLADPNVDVSASSPLAAILGPVADELRTYAEGLLAVYSAEDPDAAEGVGLDRVCAQTGTVRQGATKSKLYGSRRVVATFAAADDWPVGSRFSNSDGVIFETTETLVAPSAGDYYVASQCIEAGPIPVNAHAFEAVNGGSILDPSTGGFLTALTQPYAAVMGSAAWTDAELRLSRIAEIGAPGSGTISGLRSDLLAYENGAGERLITECEIYENVLDSIDGNNLLPHSILVVLYDAGALPDDEIAQVIFDSGGTTRTQGTSAGWARDVAGNRHRRYFRRATNIALASEISMVIDPTSYVGDEAAKAALAAYHAAYSRIGRRVYFGQWLRVLQGLQGVIGVESVLIEKLGNPFPSVSTDKVLGIYERATLDVANISITTTTE